MLKHISEKGAMKASDLSKLMEVSASHITAVTDALVEKDYITRQRSNSDRRIVELALTTKGEEMLDFYNQKKLEYFQETFKSFSEDEINQLIRLFEKILKKG
ncbi:DNA-binding MarR family transcriptional regulator [Bacillus pakistanensis]|uniref:DNA-binding MarR family transcriptional regulator n=1 Tax=Rossellomorea pakistanensis TaxID=992288 RepID=A0ABS2N8P9_9BACI|nr:DNA-binding MarR family transcriptional regulator [Bacillus pakistanensis]